MLKFYFYLLYLLYNSLHNMKTITERLSEALLFESNDIVTLLKVTKYNITPYELDHKKETMTSNAKKQEAEIIDTLKELLPSIPGNPTIYSSIDYAEIDNTKWTPLYDLNIGDIVIITDDEKYFIDVKAASKGSSLLGPISANSLLNFANKKNHFYLLLNSNGSESVLVNGQKLYDEFMKKPELMVSKDRTKPIDLKATTKGYGDYRPDGKVYAEDFISTRWINSHKRNIVA